MTRYFTRARVEDDDGHAVHPGRPYLTAEPQANEKPFFVDVADHEPSPTGILDVAGRMILREPRPIGFGRDGEW